MDTSKKGKYSSPSGSATWEYIAAMSCSSITFCIGCLMGWSAPTLPLLMASDSPVPMMPSDVSTMMASMGVGVCLSPFLLIFVIANMGRREGLLSVSAPIIIRCVLVAVATDPIVLFVANFFTGIALGLGMCLAPMYLGEIASAKLRGGMGFLIVTSLNAGTVFMFALVPHVSVRSTAYVCLILVILSGVGMWFAPESPYYLANIGKTDEAEAALEKLRGKPDVLDEFELIQSAVQEQKSKAGEAKMSYRQLLSVAGTRKAIYIQVMFSLVLQYGGCIPVSIYGQIIIEGMKSGFPAHICMTVFSVIQLTCSILTIFVIDRVGRRPLIRVASILSGFCTLIIGVYFYLMEYRGIDVSPYSIIPLCAIFVLMAATSTGIAPIQMVLMSETFATEVKALANFLLGIFSGVMVTISMMAYLNVTITWGFGHSAAFLAFTAITWTCSVLILRILPETKGKTLIEIQKDLNA